MTKDKKAERKNDLATDSLLQNYLTISINFKIRISQLNSKVNLKQRSLN